MAALSIKKISLLFVSIFLVLTHPTFAEDRIYTFGIVPQTSVSQLAKEWVPFLELVSAKSGITLQFATAPDIVTFEKRLNSGAYDFAYMNPYHYVVSHKKQGYEAFAKEKGRKIKGVIVVSKKGAIQRIQQLNGLTVVFPAPSAFAASILPRVELRKLGITIVPKFVASHESVYLNVAQEQYPAGGGIERTFGMLQPAVQDDLRILWTTSAYTPHAIARHPRVSAVVAGNLLNTLKNISNVVDGVERLKLIGFNGIEAAEDSDWDDIRQLKITDMEANAR